MRFSAFTKFGFLRYSSRKSKHEGVYRALLASMNAGTSGREAYDASPGTHVEATAFARSEAIARAGGVLERAANQHDPTRCLEMLPAHEYDYRLSPDPRATLQQRREALTARVRLNRGSRREAVEEQLRAILGPDFVAYRVVAASESTRWPLTLDARPGTYSRADLPTKYLQVLRGNAAIGTPAWVSYGNLDTTIAPVSLSVGDQITINAGDLENAERVTVTGTRTNDVGNLQFQASFTRYHALWAAITTGPFPAQFSTRRFAFVVVSDSASIDRTTRDRIAESMRRVARGVSQWAVVRKSSPTTIGPFVLGTSPLGAVPLGTITI